MRLYEIPLEVRAALDNIDVDEETGELLNTEQYTQVKEDAEDKIAASCCYIKELDSDIEQLKAQIANLSKRKRSLESKKDWLKGLCFEGMKALGGGKIKKPQITAYFSTSQSVEITDPDRVPAQFIKPQEVEFYKSLIKNELKRGIDVPGCELVSKESLAIR